MLIRTKNYNRTPMVDIGRNQQMRLSEIANVVNDINEYLSDKTVCQVSIRSDSKTATVINEPLEFFATLDDIGFVREDRSIPVSFSTKSIAALYFWYDCFDRAQMLHINMRDGSRYTLNMLLE